MRQGTKKLFPMDYERFIIAMISADKDDELPVVLRTDDIQDCSLGSVPGFQHGNRPGNECLSCFEPFWRETAAAARSEPEGNGRGAVSPITSALGSGTAGKLRAKQTRRNRRGETDGKTRRRHRIRFLKGSPVRHNQTGGRLDERISYTQRFRRRCVL